MQPVPIFSGFALGVKIIQHFSKKINKRRIVYKNGN
jgi:hypothetical protein